MHTVYHAKSSAHKWGGTEEEYMPIHDFLDQSKTSMGDVRHRAALHHTLGCRIAEQRFGVMLKLSTGREVPVRDIAELHIIEDLGWLPSIQDYFKCISLAAAPWIGGNIGALKKAKVPVSAAVQRQVAEQKEKDKTT